MHRSSESIGQLAARLPGRKSISAIRKIAGCDDPKPLSARRASEPFRYAPLSTASTSFARAWANTKIATVQDRRNDPDGGLVRLTTVLAHILGNDSRTGPSARSVRLGHPASHGGALTYARRYALFTLVGDRGEDDLMRRTPAQLSLGMLKEHLCQCRLMDAVGQYPQARNGSARKPCGPVLPPIESAAARDKLIGELGGFASADQLTTWAARQMAIKNTLSVTMPERSGAFSRQASKGSFPSEVDAVVPSRPLRIRAQGHCWRTRQPQRGRAWQSIPDGHRVG